MTFEFLQQARVEFDEIQAIGKTVERAGRYYHIVGMTRHGNVAQLYILQEEEKRKEEKQKENFEKNCDNRKKRPYSNRELMKMVRCGNYFDTVLSICVAGQEIAASGSACTECLGTINENYENAFLFYEMMKAGWKLPQEDLFRQMEFSKIWMETISFRLGCEKLPDWGEGKVVLRHRRGDRRYLLEQPICLRIGQEDEVEFSLDGYRNEICYIQKVYPIDVWETLEERFRDPQVLERFGEEELQQMKNNFFNGLEQECPKGMCYLGIEYECTRKGSILFYAKAFLEEQERPHCGSTRFLVIKPDEPVGNHGLPLHGCVIQVPVSLKIKQMDAELFQFIEPVPEWEETL